MPAQRGLGVRDGAGFLLQGMRLWRERPGLMLLGIVPALIVGALVLTVLVLLVMYADDLIDWATPFADDWETPRESASADMVKAPSLRKMRKVYI